MQDLSTEQWQQLSTRYFQAVMVEGYSGTDAVCFENGEFVVDSMKLLQFFSEHPELWG